MGTCIRKEIECEIRAIWTRAERRGDWYRAFDELSRIAAILRNLVLPPDALLESFPEDSLWEDFHFLSLVALRRLQMDSKGMAVPA